jgi:hypothetical protein
VTRESSPIEHVELVEEEVVRPGGASTVTWLVRHNDGWVRAPKHPSARSEPLERGSGIVWRLRVTLALPRGQALTRVESRPASTQRSALEHLTGGTRGAARRTSRRAYLVGPGGEVLRKPEGRA